MVAILESPAIRERVEPMTVEMYEGLGERINGHRTELIRGVILQKMPKSPPHSFLVTRLARTVEKAFGSELHCRQEQPVKFVDSMPEPDIAVVKGQPEDYLANHPKTALMVMEVAISSLVLDREKAALYAEADIPEYWIIIGDQQAVEVYAMPQSGLYTQCRLYTRTETIASSALPGLIVDLATLFPAD